MTFASKCCGPSINAIRKSSTLMNEENTFKKCLRTRARKTGKCTNLKSLPFLEGPEYITGLGLGEVASTLYLKCHIRHQKFQFLLMSWQSLTSYKRNNDQLHELSPF